MGVGNLSNGSFPKKLFTLLHEEDSTIIGFLHGKYFKVILYYDKEYQSLY